MSPGKGKGTDPEAGVRGRGQKTSAAPDPCSPAPAHGCPFCDLLGQGGAEAAEPRDGDEAATGRDLVAENILAVAFRDGFPVNPGHILIVPRRHVATWFDATREEQLAILELVAVVKARLDAELHPDGYNLGVNVGAAAGQTVPHLHLHLIPRFQGDVDDPTGGVRFVIPARGNYRNPGFIPNVGGASFATGSPRGEGAK